MKDLREFYGDTVIDKSEYNELDVEYKIELEYYKTKKNEKNSRNLKHKDESFGLEIIKKEIIGERTSIESKEFKNIVDTEEKVDKSLEILITNKVTPICVNEVLEDLMKQKIYNKLN